MSISTSALAHEDVAGLDATASPVIQPSADERWTAWRARGVAHDGALRRRMRIAVPILAIVAAALYALLIR